VNVSAKGAIKLGRELYIQKQIHTQMRKLLPGAYTRRSPRINTTTSKTAKNDLEAGLAAALAKAQTRGQIGATARKHSSNRSIPESLRLSSSERTGFGRNSSEYKHETGDTAVNEGGIERPEVQTTEETLQWWKESLNDRPLMRYLDDLEGNTSAGDELFDQLFGEVLFTIDDMQNRDKDFWSKVRTGLKPSEEEGFIEWDGYWPSEGLDDGGHGADSLENFIQRGKNLTERRKLRRSIYDVRLRYVHR
jgi:hypothetical protein